MPSSLVRDDDVGFAENTDDRWWKSISASGVDGRTLLASANISAEDFGSLSMVNKRAALRAFKVSIASRSFSRET